MFSPLADVNYFLKPAVNYLLISQLIQSSERWHQSEMHSLIPNFISLVCPCYMIFKQFILSLGKIVAESFWVLLTDIFLQKFLASFLSSVIADLPCSQLHEACIMCFNQKGLAELCGSPSFLLFQAWNFQLGTSLDCTIPGPQEEGYDVKDPGFMVKNYVDFTEDGAFATQKVLDDGHVTSCCSSTCEDNLSKNVSHSTEDKVRNYISYFCMNEFNYYQIVGLVTSKLKSFWLAITNANMLCPDTWPFRERQACGKSLEGCLMELFFTLLESERNFFHDGSTQVIFFLLLKSN